ncbi:MAG TPA: acyl-CoA dehydrogenase family protein [Jatrophihabitantaceae bacterium]|jgi:alkylation response protein AidB-like acyl-CoA dehydrogenase
MRRHLYDEPHEEFRAAFHAFLSKHATPNTDKWETQGVVDRDFWLRAGESSFLGFEAPTDLGGLDIHDFRYNAVIAEELVDCEVAGDGFALHNDIVAPYLTEYCNDEQRARWLPGFTRGETITAIAMTEPGAGSDLASITATASYEGDDVVVTGSKTFITNGPTADLVFVLARTEERDGRGMTLVAIERGTPGFDQGNPLHKIGRRAQDTGELFFDACRVNKRNIVGESGGAFDVVKKNLPRERLSIAVTAVASGRHALALALAHCRERRTFGQTLGRHQSVMHTLAQMHTELEVTGSHVDRCIVALNDGELTAEEAAAAKYWATEVQWNVIDRALQLFGGYGYMEEFPIARMWRDARVQRIYGGTTEIMTEIVGRQLMR